MCQKRKDFANEGKQEGHCVGCVAPSVQPTCLLLLSKFIYELVFSSPTKSAFSLMQSWCKAFLTRWKKKEKKEAEGRGHSAKGGLRKRNWSKQNQDKLDWCDLMWWVWKGKKEENDDEIKRRGHSAIQLTVQSWITAWVRVSKIEREKYREKEKIMEDIRWERNTVRKKAVIEKNFR